MKYLLTVEAIFMFKFLNFLLHQKTSEDKNKNNTNYNTQLQRKNLPEVQEYAAVIEQAPPLSELVVLPKSEQNRTKSDIPIQVKSLILSLKKDFSVSNQSEKGHKSSERRSRSERMFYFNGVVYQNTLKGPLTPGTLFCSCYCALVTWNLKRQITMTFLQFLFPLLDKSYKKNW